MIKRIMVMIFMSVSMYASSYVCETNPEYIEYMNGERVILSDSSKFDDEAVCNESCRRYSSCIDGRIVADGVILTIGNREFLTEEEKDDVESKMASGLFSKLYITADGTKNEVDLGGQVSLSDWTAPIGTPTVDNPILTNSYAYGSLLFKWEKTLSITGGTVDSIHKIYVEPNDISNMFDKAVPGVDGKGVYYIEIDGTKIAVDQNQSSNNPTLPGMIYEDAYNYVKMVDNNGTYSIEYKVAGVVKTAFDDGTFHDMKLIGGVFTEPAKYRILTSINGVDANMEGGTYVDMFGVEQQHSFGIEYQINNNGYKCSIFGNSTNLGGDLGPNLFTSQYNCESVCYNQDQCIPWEESTCKLVGTEVAKPVTDYTGKTVFTQKTYNWACDKEYEKIVGCNKWAVVTQAGNTDIGTYDPGYETLDFSANFTDAIGAASIGENSLHIWSGWAGYCENGMLFDNSWMSDPMQLLSLATMAFTGALQGGYGDTLQGLAQSGADSVLSAADSAAEWANNVGVIGDDTYFKVIDTIWDTSDTVVQTVQGGTPSITESLSRAVSYETSTDLLRIASDVYTIATPLFSEVSEEDVKEADDYMKAIMGESQVEQAALNYATCMSSIGLSFVDMAGYTADANITSEELLSPTQHPARLTVSQFHTLQVLSVGMNIKENYLVTKVENDILTITPLTRIALTNIGEAICAPLKTAYIKQKRTTLAAENSSSGGSKGAAMATAAVGAAIGYLPPPYNLIGTIIFKMLTSISDGDACTDYDLAMKWGITQAKTNKAIQGNQCHLQMSFCVKKWVWGSCMRHRTNFCCYDQETTKIFVEAVKEELNKGWWSCNDISIYDMQNVSFRECESGETPSKDKCMSSAKYQELINVLMKNATKGLDVGRLANQAAESLQLPGQKTPWEE